MKRDRKRLRQLKQFTELKYALTVIPENRQIEKAYIAKLLQKYPKITIEPSVLEFWEWCDSHPDELKKGIDSIKKINL